MTGARGLMPSWLAWCCCGTAKTAHRTGWDTLAPHTEQRAARLAPVATAVDQLERRLARRGPLAETRGADEAVTARAQPEGSRRGVGAWQPPGTWRTVWRLLGLSSGLGSAPGCAGAPRATREAVRAGGALSASRLGATLSLRRPRERTQLTAARRREELADGRGRLGAPAGAGRRACFRLAPRAPAHHLRAAAEHGPPDAHDVHGTRQHERRGQTVAPGHVEAAAGSQLPQRARCDASIQVNRAALHQAEVGCERSELGCLRALCSSRDRTVPG